MKQFGQRTTAFRSFNNDLEQSFLLAGAVSRGGISAMKDCMSSLDSVIQKVSGVDAEAIGKMTDEDKVKVCLGASEKDIAKLDSLKKEAEQYLRLGKETVPVVLFVYLITKFEAYLEDIITTACQTNPSLISLPLNADEEEVIAEVGKRIDKRVDEIGEDVLEKTMQIPFSLICKAAKTTPKELDRAKAIRNIHIHNRGFVNKRNQKRIGNAAMGEYVPISIQYLIETKDKIFLTCLGIDKAVIERYPETINL
ncbi:MAG: hypothetical protein AB1631_27240 [Acidobacteriota bacterium]